MPPTTTREPHELAREELQAELLARNIFRTVMVGAVAFLAACAWVLAQ